MTCVYRYRLLSLKIVIISTEFSEKVSVYSIVRKSNFLLCFTPVPPGIFLKTGWYIFQIHFLTVIVSSVGCKLTRFVTNGLSFLKT